jgi:hypothetical protein
MRKLWSTVVGACAIAAAFGVGAPAWAASGAGPYYATPSWDQKLACSTAANCPRFVVLTDWNNEAVLDRETGAIWQQSPSSQSQDWFSASVNCLLTTGGGRAGWRLPTVQELLSLIDFSSATPSLPPGHPFGNVQIGSLYWSVTSSGFDANTVFLVRFNGDENFGNVSARVAFGNRSAGSALRWCVRGGEAVSPQ